MAEDHYCNIHNTPFKQYHKKDENGNPIGEGWYSHPIEGGGWCNEKKKSDKPASRRDASLLSSEQVIRKYALEKAHIVYSVKSPDEISSDGILALARKYEGYIKNG